MLLKKKHEATKSRSKLQNQNKRVKLTQLVTWIAIKVKWTE